MKKDQKLILIFILILVIIFIICIFCLLYMRKGKYSMNTNGNIIAKNEIHDNNEDLNESYNITHHYGNTIDNGTDNNSSVRSNTIPANIKAEAEDIDSWGEDEPIKDENLRLFQTEKPYAYLLMKQCISSFYSSRENAYKILPIELKNHDISEFYGNINSCDFCIDKIYQANVSLSKEVYFVYYREQKNDTACESKSLVVKLDKKNLSFAIYPYEYLKAKNCSELKANDLISLEIINTKDIENIQVNHYRVNDIIKDNLTYSKELFERFKFDTKYDLEHLYNSIDGEYKKTRFNNDYNKFTTYINNKKEEYSKEIYKGYQIFSNDKSLQLIAVSESNNHYVFNMLSLMKYSVQLDNYTTSLPLYASLYHSSFPNVRAKYCIDRVRKAINDKNYEFIYAKLNSVQKSNYYKEYNDFVKYIQIYFYEKNKFEYGDYVKVSEKTYRYSVDVIDANNDSAIRKMTMTITLKNKEDFEISITL